jgi:2-hydroxychromene-2-carboxylate isomerase
MEYMGDVIYIKDRLEARAQVEEPRALRPAFFFDLACPLSYLSAERIERALGDVEWIPASLSAAGPTRPAFYAAATRAHAETLAIALRIPLIWPDGFPAECPRAMRAACHAVEIGAGARFALAAGRLAFCGGFDLEDPDILAEAAAAAGIQPECSLAAAADPAYDAELHGTARRLRAAGVSQLPAICTDEQWLDGESAVARAMALRQALRLGRG